MSSDLLVVDDSAQNLEILATLLTAHGHSVRTATGGHEALRLARQRPPDLVLLDVNMPDLDGFEVCRTLRETWDHAKMPVVFLSAAGDPTSKVKAFQLGAIDFVTKPFHFPEVLARVDSQLELKRRTEELEATNAQLKRIEERRRQFITALVHDIKNPLTPMLKNTEWLLEQQLPDVDPEVTEVLRDVHVASRHLYRMVLSLLDVARGAEEALELKPRPTRLAAWLDDALTLIRLQLRSQPGRLVVTCEEGEATFDPQILARVLQNLVDNALKYTPHAEPIRVEVGLHDGALRLSIEDRGPGIEPQERERLFTPWVRLDDAASGARPSYGIGLAFCKQAVEAHGGRIALEDASPRGARFVVHLPGQASSE